MKKLHNYLTEKRILGGRSSFNDFLPKSQILVQSRNVPSRNTKSRNQDLNEGFFRENPHT